MKNNSDTEPFDSLAWAYDILFPPDWRLSQEGEFIKNLVTPGIRVLEQACGTGVHAHFMAELGAQVTACDISSEMLKVAKEKRPHNNISYAIHDMKNSYPDKFDLVICIGNSLNLLPTRRDVQQTLRGFRQNLNPGGSILIHVINISCPRYQQPHTTSNTGIVNKQKIVATKTVLPHDDKHLLMVNCYSEGENGKKQVLAQSSVLLDLTWNEIDTMMEHTGLTQRKWFGGFDGHKLDPEKSPGLLVLAKTNFKEKTDDRESR